MSSASQLRQDALRIWRAGVEAVLPDKLLEREVSVAGGVLSIGDWEAPLDSIGRIAVVGGGKAGAAMVRGLETALGPEVIANHQVGGWVNVPAGTVEPTIAVHLHAGRPTGVNEPRPEGVEGTRQILREVSTLAPGDLCICLLSGGGSALLPAPAAGISLEVKAAITRLLSASGATIDQLNCVRRQLSDIKGGGLARACTAGTLLTLVVSDVLGDPLDTIASGPTYPCHEGPQHALQVLRELNIAEHSDAQPVVEFLQRRIEAGDGPKPEPSCQVEHLVLANNATAVDAAGIEAERLGYNHAMLCATESEGPAEDVGRHLAEMAITMRDQPGPNCLITGGEPTVTLAPPERRGKGGRNQQLVLAAIEELEDCHRVALLSGGTDGEDGPTDAAGALVDADVVAAAEQQGLSPADYLARNDAYHFFEPLDALVITGPTGTNVCDIRVVVVDQVC
ncbi:glycerate kinase type-2 family protein [Aeoliella sp.]|uniref:glycerate kinase type-2 family protein n=1 Tax=Aeoliella sp. TaxID=2795800 RepID=UPI003CCC1CBA